MHRVGMIDGRRIGVSGVPGFEGAPSLLNPLDRNFFGIMDHFLQMGFDAGGAIAPTGWLRRETGGGLMQIAGVMGGVLLMRTAGGNNDNEQITLGGNANGAFFPQVNHDIFFEARVFTTLAAAAITTPNYGLGLIAPANADYLADNGGAHPNNNFMGFFKRDGEGDIFFAGRNAGGGIDNNDLGIAWPDSTWMTLGLHCYNVAAALVCDVYVNRVQIAAGTLATANIPIVGLMPFFAVKAGDANLEAINPDYIVCMQRL